MRLRRRLLLTALLLTGAGLMVLALASCRAPLSPIRHSAYEAIPLGMTEAEVARLLRGPAGNYRTTDVACDDPLEIQEGDISVSAEVNADQPPFRAACWVGDWGLIRLNFDRHDRVVFKLFRPLEPPPSRVRTFIRQMLRR